jgi:hypothetical protein
MMNDPPKAERIIIENLELTAGRQYSWYGTIQKLDQLKFFIRQSSFLALRG